jgi:hypothetical protein
MRGDKMSFKEHSRWNRIHVAGISKIEIRNSDGTWDAFGRLVPPLAETDPLLSQQVERIFQEAEDLWQWMEKR